MVLLRETKSVLKSWAVGYVGFNISVRIDAYGLVLDVLPVYGGGAGDCRAKTSCYLY